MSVQRGALIVFEGCDKVGKSTQVKKLVEKLWDLGVKAESFQFPDRTTATGKIINDYLSKKVELSNQAVHLLFSANRWENEPKMKQLLFDGVTLIVDRYSFSGVAYSASKPDLDFDWCRNPDIGLPKPDVVFFLNVSSDDLIKRSGFGEERYESNQFQQTAYKNYLKMKDNSWKVIDANKSVEDLHQELLKFTQEVIKDAQNKKLESLW